MTEPPSGLLRPAGIDAVAWLTLYIVVLYAIPSRLVFGPLGGAGAPSQVVGLLSLMWWGAYHLGRSRRTSLGIQPVRLATGVFLICVGVSYVVAMVRPIEYDEVSSADLALVAMASWIGTLLIASDGIADRDRLGVLVRRLTIAGGLLALLGIAQFIFKQSFVNLIQIPGQRPTGPTAVATAGTGSPARPGRPYTPSSTARS